MVKSARQIIAVAESQIGYCEKRSNDYLDYFAANAGSGNYTKYARDLRNAGYYNGDKNGYAWCDVFVDWCVWAACGGDRYTAEDIECQTGDLGAGCVYSRKYYINAGRYSTEPQVGDQIFFADSYGEAGHTGIVYKVEDKAVYTIEGNAGDKVKRCVYSRDSKIIMGYGHPKYEGTEFDPAQFRPELQNGSEGGYALALQQMLTEAGYGVEQDGVFGADTLAAVKRFQSEHGLDADGCVGPKTWKALDEAKPVTVSGERVAMLQILTGFYPVNGELDKELTELLDYYTLGTGATGMFVKLAQYWLNLAGYKCEIDEEFGKETEIAVKNFQSDHKLDVDGEIGPKTWKKLVAM